jgi:hypothetical protein
LTRGIEVLPASSPTPSTRSQPNVTAMARAYPSATRSDSGSVFVMHRPNAPSGGRTSRYEISEFLAGGNGPQHRALLRLIGALVDEVTGPEASRQ